MERHIDGPVLLVGEANFSFTLSLVTYVNPKLITTSCYESKSEAMRKYGADLVERNEQSLLELGCEVLFGIDACDLKHHFPNQKFSRIIFMFPHVGGKSNLKKNRLLLDGFFRSTKQVLDVDHLNAEAEFSVTSDKFNQANGSISRSSVFVALAKGQGGTQFESDPLKRNNKDSWQILHLAQANGFIMTECFNLDESRYNFYKSTGFRSQHKSFITNSSLVHKFELSLPFSASVASSSELRFSAMRERIRGAKAENRMVSMNPFIGFTNDFAERVRDMLNSVAISFFENDSNCPAISSLDVEKDLQRYLDLISKSQGICEDRLNVSSDLRTPVYAKPEDEHSLPERISFEALNDYNYQLLVYFRGSRTDVKSHLEQFITESLRQNGHLVKTDSTQVADHNANESKLVVGKISLEFSQKLLVLSISREAPTNELLFILDVDYYLQLLHGLSDKRILYSTDVRTFPSENQVKPYSIENPIWTHDISFWFSPLEFSRTDFTNTVRDFGKGLLIDVNLIDRYEDLGVSESSRHSACYRLSYQAVDTALTWEMSKQINCQIRDQLAKKCKIILR